MIQSQQVLAWVAEGEVKGRAETLLEILDLIFGQVPAEVASAIRATTDLARLKQWVAAAVRAPTLDVFRQSTQLGERVGCLATGKGTAEQTAVLPSNFGLLACVRSVQILLELKFHSIPQDLVNAISNTRDFDKLERWFRAAMDAASLADFRQAANL